MIRIAIVLSSFFVAAASCMAQPFEVGVLGGFAGGPSLKLSGPAGTADAGLKNGFAAGAALTDHVFEHLSGELRYTFRKGDLKLSSGGSEARFDGLSQSVHYAFLVFPNPRKARLRPFLSAGGGARFYQGIGAETPSQTLSQFAILTKTREFQPLVTAGAGFMAAVGSRFSLRVEFQDFMTPAPTKVIAPVNGSQLRGWLHDLTPMVGISYTLTPAR